MKKTKHIILVVVLFGLVISAAYYFYATSIRFSPQDSDQEIAEKLKKILQADNPECTLNVGCQTINGYKNITMLLGDKIICKIQGLNKLRNLKSAVTIVGKFSEFPDLSGTQIESLTLLNSQDFKINIDQLHTMPNIKYFGFKPTEVQEFVPTQTNVNLISLSIDFKNGSSFNPAILSSFPNLKIFIIGSTTAQMSFVPPPTRLPMSLDVLTICGKSVDYLNLVKAFSGVRTLVLFDGKFDLAGLSGAAPELTTLSLKECTVINPQALLQLPKLETIVFSGYSPQAVEKLTQGLPPQIKIIQYSKDISQINQK